MMKKKLLVFMLIVWPLMQVTVKAASIDDVLVVPENPSSLDVITVISSGMNHSIVPIEFTEQTLTPGSPGDNDYLLELNIYFDFSGIISPAVTPWEHSEEIGTLSPGEYFLIVQTLGDPSPSNNDTYETRFTVIPEPATLTLLTMGMWGIVRSRKFRL